MYKVVADFKDLRDGGYEYKAGDVYPRDGVEVGAERISVLSAPTKGRGALISELLIAEISPASEEPAEIEEPKPKPKARAKKAKE